MPTNPPLTSTHVATVAPEHIDDLGHMNVRWYGHHAVMGSRALGQHLGLQPDLGLISAYTRHHNEQMEGSELEVSSGVLDGPTLRFHHELRNRSDGQLAATFVHELDHPPIEVPLMAVPDYAAPRSLQLESNALASAPALAELRDRDLAMRLERTVTTEDSHGADVVPTWLVNNLIWGGERIDEGPWIHAGPNGERIAFANMESRTWIGAAAPLGIRIQSFGATVHMSEKITRTVNWAFDLDTEQPVAVFEVVNLCFDLNTRRSLAMPPVTRKRQMARFHPDLAPAPTS